MFVLNIIRIVLLNALILSDFNIYLRSSGQLVLHLYSYCLFQSVIIMKLLRAIILQQFEYSFSLLTGGSSCCRGGGCF